MRARRTRRVACGAVAAGILVLGGAGYALKDRLIEEWHIRRLRSGDFVERFAAARSLGEAGSSRAVPELTALLRESRGHDAEAGEVWGAGASPCSSVADVLVRIGPAAIPALAGALERSDGAAELWRRNACWALGEIGTDAALPPLIARVEDADGCVGLIAVERLGSLGSRAAPAVPALTDALGSRRAYIRRAAKHALEAIRDGDSDATVPAR